MNLFHEDGLVGRMFTFLGQLILLNLLWIVCSLPVVTMGASTTALYFVALKMHKDKEVSVWKLFFQSFRQNFIQSTAAWLLLAAAGGVLFIRYHVLLLGAAMLVAVLTMYLFPVIAAYSNRLPVLIGHAYYFAFRKPLYLLAVMAVSCLPMYFTVLDFALLPLYLLVWLLVGFALTAYVGAWFFLRMFRC